MAATLGMTEHYGAAAGTRAATSYLNLLSANIASGADATTVPAANTVTIPGTGTAYSYERYFQGRWTGTWTSITNVKFWKQAGSLGTGVTIKAGDSTGQTYTAAVVTASSVATADIPTVVGSALDLTPASAITPSTQEYSDYGVMQMHVASTAAAGNIGTQTYRTQWDET